MHIQTFKIKIELHEVNNEYRVLFVLPADTFHDNIYASVHFYNLKVIFVDLLLAVVA